MNKQFFPQVDLDLAEQTRPRLFIFQYLLNKLFFHKKTIDPRNQMVGPLMLKNAGKRVNRSSFHIGLPLDC